MLNQLYHKLEESGQVSINCIDWIQHFRRIVNNYKIGNVTASLNSIIFLFRQYIESTNVKSETFSIKALIDNTVSKIKQDFENEDIELNIQNDIQNLVIGDSFRIKAVLSQLIGSAIINSIKNCKIAINVNQNSKILHDTIEDTSLTKDNIAEAFSIKIAEQVSDLTRISGNKKISSRQMIKTLRLQNKKDLLLIKFRLHNIKTISIKPYDKRQRIVIETEQEFVPLARYLKLSEIADELSGYCILNAATNKTYTQIYP